MESLSFFKKKSFLEVNFGVLNKKDDQCCCLFFRIHFVYIGVCMYILYNKQGTELVEKKGLRGREMININELIKNKV